MAKVSVIVNTVDRPFDLNRCLEAVLVQTYPDFEIVVVNNGVGEETDRLLQNLKIRCQNLNIGCRIIEDQTKKLSYLFNLGWKSADSKSLYFAYCADDTEPGRDWLRSAVEYLDQNPSCGGVSGPTLSTTNPPGEMFYLRDLAKKNFFTRFVLRLYEYFVMEDKTMEPGFWPQSGAFTMGAGIPLPNIVKPLEIDLLTSGNMVVRRKAMEEISGFDENFLFNHADGDLFVRLKKAGYKLVFHPDVSVLHHMRFGPTRYPWILGRDTAFYYLKDVRPRSFRGYVGAVINVLILNFYFVFKAIQLKRMDYLKGISGFLHGAADFFKTPGPERSKLLKSLSVFAAFIVLFSLALRGVLGFEIMAYGDTPPFPKNPLSAFKAFFSNWFYQSPGIRMPEMAPVYTLNWLVGLLIVHFFGNAALAQKFFHFLPLPLSFIIMYLSLSEVTPLKFPRFLGSFIYSANLVIVGEVLGGSEDNLYTQALFPILILLLYRFYKGQLYPRYLALFSLIASSLFLFSDHFLLLLTPFLFIYMILSFKDFLQKRGTFIKLIFPILGLILVILLTISYFADYLKISLPYLSGVKIDAETLKFLKGNVDDTYRHYIFTDILRAGGDYYLDLFRKDIFWARTGFILPLLSFTWLAFPGNRRGSKLKIGLLITLLALADIFFIDRIRGERLSFLFERFPFLFRFRNPARLTRLLLFCYSILSTLTLAGLWSLMRQLFSSSRRFLARIVFLLIIFSFATILFYFSPFLSGDFTLRVHRGLGLEVQPRYEHLATWFNKGQGEAGFYRVLFLPWNHEEGEIKFYWLFPQMYGVAINYGAYAKNDYLMNMEGIYKDLAAGRLVGMTERLNRSGIKYLVLNTESGESGVTRYSFDYQTPWLLGSASEYRKTVERIDQVKLVAEFEGFRVYRNWGFDGGKIDKVLSGQPNEIFSLGRLTLIVVNLVILIPVLFFLIRRYLVSL